jgi:protein-tyrosine phosphatase
MREILLLCTANICRSPMAQALLARELGARGMAALVSSGGMLGSGASPPCEVVTAMAGRGLDVSGHKSRQVTAGDLARADLILGMAREHVRHAVVVHPHAWPRAFTIRELVRRGDLVGTRQPGETLSGWLARAHEGRDGLALLGDSPQDDVADPIGGPANAYERTAAELEQLAGRLADRCWVAGAGY